MSLFPLTTKMFPEVQATDRTYQLHHYIAHGESKKADFWMARMQPNLDARDPVHGLTPLAIAAIAGDAPMAQKLLEGGADAKLADVHGWTPLHFATLQQDEAMMTVFKTHDVGLAAIENRAGLTPEALFERTKVEPASDDEQVFYYKNEAGEVVAGSAKTFRELTGAAFTPRLLATPKGLMAEWLRTIHFFEDQHAVYASTHGKLIQTLDEKMKAINGKHVAQRLQTHTPKVYLQKGAAGWGLFAGEEIAKGCPIVPFGGELDETLDKLPESDCYYWEGVEGQSARHLGAMVNDSIPNAALLLAPYEDGLSRFPYVMALKPIKSGEEILVDYGRLSDLKFFHKELNERGLEEFFAHTRLSALFEKMSDKELPKRNIHVFTLYKTILDYVSTTPDAVLHLILKGGISRAELKRLQAHLKQSVGVENEPGILKLMPNFLQAMDVCFQHAGQLTAQIKEELTKVNRERPIRLVLLLLQFIKARLSANQAPLSWVEVSSTIDAFDKLLSPLSQLEKKSNVRELDAEAFRGFLFALQSVPVCMQKMLFSQIHESLYVLKLWDEAVQALDETPDLIYFAGGMLD